MTFTTSYITQINSVSSDQSCDSNKKLEYAGIQSEYSQNIQEFISSTSPLHLPIYDGDTLFLLAITSTGNFEVSVSNNGVEDVYSGVEANGYLLSSTAGVTVSHIKLRTTSVDRVLVDMKVVGSNP